MYVSDVDEESNERRGRDDVVSIVRVMSSRLLLWICLYNKCTTSGHGDFIVYKLRQCERVVCVCVCEDNGSGGD